MVMRKNVIRVAVGGFAGLAIIGSVAAYNSASAATPSPAVTVTATATATATVTAPAPPAPTVTVTAPAPKPTHSKVVTPPVSQAPPNLSVATPVYHPTQRPSYVAVNPPVAPQPVATPAATDHGTEVTYIRLIDVITHDTVRVDYLLGVYPPDVALDYAKQSGYAFGGSWYGYLND
jgi:hypothetical protein